MQEYSVTTRGKVSWRYVLRDNTSTTEDALVILMVLFGQRPMDLETLQEVARSYFDGNFDRPRLRRSALYLRDHTQAVVAGALARGWVTVAEAPK
jgi:hypothetical protein